MAEDLNQEPTAEEKAKFEQDVLKAAEEAMKMEAEANKADAAERHCEEQGDEAIQKALKRRSLRKAFFVTKMLPKR